VRDNGLSFAAAALASPDASQAKTDKSGRTSIAITVMDVKVLQLLVFISLSGFHRGLAKSLLGWLRSQRDQHGLLYSTLND
jgi:hypothetical protein